MITRIEQQQTKRKRKRKQSDSDRFIEMVERDQGYQTRVVLNTNKHANERTNKARSQAKRLGETA